LLINDFLSFFNLEDKSLDFTDFRNSSKLPFLSTDLTPAFETVSFKLFFKISLLNFTFLRFGKNLLLVLLLA